MPENRLKIRFLGASGTVTGSGYFLSKPNGRGLIVDLGMFQGTKEENELNLKPVDVDFSKVDNVLLTHSHLDHCGRLPLLTKGGFKGKIFMTEATRELTELVLLDAARIAEKESVGEPLYTIDDVYETINLFETFRYGQKFRADDFQVKPFDAGHLLGSVSFLLEYNGRKIVFSGDLGNSPETIVKPIEYINENADIVVEETTYGDRNHPKEDSVKILEREIKLVEANGGTLLIPSFSLNRTQDLLYKIKCLKRIKKMKNQTPVYMDSPMADSATKIHRKFKDLFNHNLLQEFRKGDPFSFPGLIIRRKVGKKMSLRGVRGPKVIIAGGGMMSGGRIVHHAKDFLGEKKTRLLIVGYQGEETLGREIQEGAKEVVIEKKRVQIKASITKIDGMSSHAGQDELLKWLTKIRGVKKLILTHGDDASRMVYKNLVFSKTGIRDVTTPLLGQEILL